jgi:tetratricopeptide (TPR) repeat protein
MATSLVLLVLLGFVAPSPPPAGSPPQSPAQAGQSEHVRNGVQHFERAFYELTPTKRDAEASREFDLAVAEFEAEAAARPSSAVAQAYLGRIYGIRKEFKKSAVHYDQLSVLQPQNLDALVFAALAYAEDGQFSEARARLETARSRTADPEALARLAGYLSKLDAVKR